MTEKEKDLNSDDTDTLKEAKKWTLSHKGNIVEFILC